MRIIKPGKFIPGKKEFECKYCGCAFEAEKHEYEITMSPTNDLWREAYCPCCGMAVYERVEEL